MSGCEVEHCDRDYAAKGMCHLHYKRNRRHGDPSVAHRMVRRGSSRAERLQELTNRRSPDECWEWKGTGHHTGYGTLQIDGVQKGAHVWAYIEAYGPVPDGLNVLHSCDNRLCVNPGHLRAGTHDENMADKVERDRVARNLGESGPNKISEVQALEIIDRYGKGGTTHRLLGLEYGISPSQVGFIVTGKRWPHLQRQKAEVA